MTKREWQTCADPQPMLRYLIGTDEGRVQSVESFPDARGSDRKLRLFACACFHSIAHLLPDAEARAAVETAEGFANGTISQATAETVDSILSERSTALEPTWRAARGAERAALHPTCAALALARMCLWDAPQKAAWYASSNAHIEGPLLQYPSVDPHDQRIGTASTTVKKRHCELLRHIFGNPFRKITFNKKWRTDTTVAISRQMFDSREFGAMPILADALQDAGCEDDTILTHCRDANQVHVRGCWVCDLVLGKE